MSSPGDGKPDGTPGKIAGHAAARGPSPSDAFNYSSSDHPPQHVVSMPILEPQQRMFPRQTLQELASVVDRYE